MNAYYRINYPNLYDAGKIYHVTNNLGTGFYSTNYKSNAMRKIRRCCAQNPGCLFILVGALCPPFYTYHFVDGKEVNGHLDRKKIAPKTVAR